VCPNFPAWFRNRPTVTDGLSPKLNLAGREADNSDPSGVDFKNDRSYTSISYMPSSSAHKLLCLYLYTHIQIKSK
jgi:hypothetical protein